MRELSSIKNRIQKELVENILPFWGNQMLDSEFGGFYGRAANDLSIDKTADKSCVLISQILWTFSAAYSFFNDENCRKTAEHAFRFLKDAFYDHKYGGLYFTVDYKGSPENRKKIVCGIASGINGLSEFYRATGTSKAFQWLSSCSNLLKKHF